VNPTRKVSRGTARQTGRWFHLASATRSLRAAANAGIFLFNVFPMLPSRPVNWRTKPPLVERLRYPTSSGEAEGDLYRPPGRGPHPGVVVCLGVVPFEVNHPQVPRLGAALARAGFAALLYWSPAMRDSRLDPADSENIALVYDCLLAQPYVDPARSGLLGTCVGGSFALLAAAQPAIRDRISYVLAYAPFASMWTLARDVASATRVRDAAREPWQVDPLTRKVYVRTFTAVLEPSEAEQLRTGDQQPSRPGDGRDLSVAGRVVATLLTRLSVDDAEAALRRLPTALQDRLNAMSPLLYAKDLHAPLIVLCHDRDDPVIPVSETRALAAALAGHTRVRYTEFTIFQHLDPTKRKVAWFKLAWELGRFCHATYPVFRQAVAARPAGLADTTMSYAS
jgi:dienelactone hydrolase